MKNKTTLKAKTYATFISNLKTQIKTAQIKAHLAVNRELILLYFKIGKSILEKQIKEGWGAKIIERISRDLSKAFPDMTGLSRANMFYMRKFAEIYENEIVQQPVGQLEKLPVFNIPWGHNMVLMDRVSSNKERFWYAKQALENGWSRNVLTHQINTDLYSRQAKLERKTHNFHLTLPKKHSDLATEILKDEYNFEFIDTSKLLKERNLESALIDNVVKFLLELGAGFAFVGKQYHFEVEGEDFYIDLLFYHLKLRSYVVIELKTGKFRPEYAGKLGFYLSCVDDFLKTKHDNSSIGIMLCEDVSKEIKKKSLQCMMKPIGVSAYKMAKPSELPKELKPILKLGKK